MKEGDIVKIKYIGIPENELPSYKVTKVWIGGWFDADIIPETKLSLTRMIELDCAMPYNQLLSQREETIL